MLSWVNVSVTILNRVMPWCVAMGPASKWLFVMTPRLVLEKCDWRHPNTLPSSAPSSPNTCRRSIPTPRECKRPTLLVYITVSIKFPRAQTTKFNCFSLTRTTVAIVRHFLQTSWWSRILHPSYGTEQFARGISLFPWRNLVRQRRGQGPILSATDVRLTGLGWRIDPQRTR